MKMADCDLDRDRGGWVLGRLLRLALSRHLLDDSRLLVGFDARRLDLEES
jgi:hypothetical protein